MGEEVRIDLVSKADTSGFDAMGKAGGTASAGMAGVSKESKDMAQNMGRGIEVGNATTALMSNLANASKGGAEGMFAAARATASFAQVVKGIVAGAGPIGLAIAAIGLLGGAVFALKDKFTAPSEGADEFKKRIDALNKAKLESVVGQLNDITIAADKGKAAIIAEAAEIDKMADAKLARDKAMVEADGSLSQEEKQKRTTKLSRDREDERINQTATTMDKRAAIDEEAATATGKVLKKAGDELSSAVNARSRIGELKKLEEDLLSQLGPTLGASDEVRARDKEIRDKLDTVQAFRKSAEGKLPETDAKIPALQDALEKARGEFSKDAKASDASRKAADDFKRQQSALGAITAETRKYEDKAGAAKIPLTASQQAAQDAADVNARMTLPVEYRNRIASGATVDREQLKRIYPGEVFGEYSPRALGGPASGTTQMGGGSLPGDGKADGTKIKVDAKPLEKGLKDNNDKTRAAIDAELAKVAAGVAAQAVALTATAAATATLASAQAAMQATVAQMQSQISNMRTNG